MAEERWLGQLRDRLEIEDLLTRYCAAIDAKDFDLLDEVFTADATIDYTRSGGICDRYPTVKGRFKIYAKYRATRITGPGYDLPNVPWTMYFHSSYALHGAFWHSVFGHLRSHGCVNMTPRDAKWIFDWSEPRLPLGWHGVVATKDRPGTVVKVTD